MLNTKIRRQDLKQKVKKCGINENNENNKKATVEYIQYTRKWLFFKLGNQKKVTS